MKKAIIIAIGMIWLVVLAFGMSKAFAETCTTDCNEYGCTTRCTE